MPAAAPAKGLLSRVVGVLTSPRDTYADIVARPRWFGLAAIILAFAVIPSSVLMSTEVGQRALLDEQVQTIEAFGRTVTDQQYQLLQRYASFGPYLAAVNTLIVLPLAALAVAGILLAVFNGLMGDTARFAQVFAVVVGSGAVVVLWGLFSAPLDYARETLSSPTSLNAVLPFFEDNTFAARLLGSIDLFIVWWMVSLSIGMGVLYKRRTAPIAATLLGVYVLIGLGIALVRAMLSGA
jgi:Yip1 domain